MFEGRKAEGVLHDNGISVPFVPNFPVKRAIWGRKRGNESSIARSFVLQFVKFVSADQLAVIIHYLSVIPLAFLRNAKVLHCQPLAVVSLCNGRHTNVTIDVAHVDSSSKLRKLIHSDFRGILDCIWVWLPILP